MAIDQGAASRRPPDAIRRSRGALLPASNLEIRLLRTYSRPKRPNDPDQLMHVRRRRRILPPPQATVRELLERRADPSSDLVEQLALGSGLGGPDLFILTLRQTVKKCDPSFWSAMCACELQASNVQKANFAAVLRELPAGIHQVGRIRIVRSGGCMSLDCEECREFVSLRRAKRMMARLDLGRKGGPVGETTFTIPPQIRGRFADPSLFRAARRAAWKILKQIAGARYGVACAHPVGDKSPDVFHPHVHFLWIGPEGWLGFLPEETVRKIRESWQDWLNVKVVDVHHSYTKGDEPGKLFHRCRYVGRSFPGFSAWCGSLGWFGAYPKLELVSDKVCHKCRAPIRVIGSATRAQFELYRATEEAEMPPYLLSRGWTGELPPGPAPP